MSTQEIIEKIATIENGLAATKDPDIIRILKTGLSKYRALLAQKKSEPQQVQPERVQEGQEQVIISQKVEKSFNLEVQKVQITLYKKDPIEHTEQQLQDYTRKYFGVVFTLRKFQNGIKNGDIDSLLSSISFYNLCQYFAGLKKFRREIEAKDVLIDYSKYSTAKKKESQILLDYLKSKVK